MASGDGLMPDENVVVPNENIDVPDGLSESEASDVNSLDHMESDEDDPELVGVRVRHMEDSNSKMLKKQEYERLIASCKQKTNVIDNEEVRVNEEVRDNEEVRVNAEVRDDNEEVRDNAEVMDGSRKKTKAKGKAIAADK
ncbi:hypothetical protein FRX31_014333, partial [Thalictrum thalictroides]